MLLIIVGIFCLIVGKIKLTPKHSLYGKTARLYGVTLLIVAMPVNIFLSVIVGAIAGALNQDIAGQSIKWLGILLQILIAIVILIPFKKMEAEVEASQPVTPSPLRPLIYIFPILSIISFFGQMQIMNREDHFGLSEIALKAIFIFNGFLAFVTFCCLYIIIKNLIKKYVLKK